MTYYKTNVAILYGMDIRTFYHRCVREQVLAELPKLRKRKVILTEKDVAIIRQRIGPPGFTSRYVRG